MRWMLACLLLSLARAEDDAAPADEAPPPAAGEAPDAEDDPADPPPELEQQRGVVGGTIGNLDPALQGVRGVYWADVKVKRKAEARFPAAAEALGLTEATCEVRFFIDEEGRPYDVRVSECDPVFHEEARSAAWKYKFYPVKLEDGSPTKASFVLRFTFRRG